MPIWAWVLCSFLALLGLLALVLALFRIRYHFEWRGVWEPSDKHLYGNSEGSILFQYGIPGFMRTWEPFKEKSWSIGDLIPDEEEDVDENVGGRKSSVDPEPVNRFSGKEQTVRESAPESETDRAARLKARESLNKKRRALFRLATDGDAWRLLTHYGLKVTRMLLRLLKPRVEAAIGGLEPAHLGRLAGKWYAVRPLLPLGDAEMNFRFQDRHPSLWVRVEGGFSALSVLGFGIKLLVAFPSLRLARRAFQSWRRHRLTGWRGWAYRKLQTRR